MKIFMNIFETTRKKCATANYFKIVVHLFENRHVNVVGYLVIFVDTLVSR